MVRVLVSKGGGGEGVPLCFAGYLVSSVFPGHLFRNGILARLIDLSCLHALNEVDLATLLSSLPARQRLLLVFVTPAAVCESARRTPSFTPNPCRVLRAACSLSKDDAEIDLLSVENGGVEVACSNDHYGEPKNMIKVCVRSGGVFFLPSVKGFCLSPRCVLRIRFPRTSIVELTCRIVDRHYWVISLCCNIQQHHYRHRRCCCCFCWSFLRCPAATSRRGTKPDPNGCSRDGEST